MKVRSVAIAAICVAAAASAQDAEFAGWSAEAGKNMITYTSPDKSALVMVMEMTEGPNPVSLNALADNFISSVAKPDNCPAMKGAVVQTTLNGQGVRAASSIPTLANSVKCSFVFGKVGKKVVLVFEVQPGRSTTVLMPKMEAVVSHRLGIPARSASSTNTLRPSGSTAPPPATSSSDAALKAALASVPVANRPIAMVGRATGSYSGGFNYVVYMPWMIFANGYATDASCFDWDPRYTAPTPAALSGPPHKCDVERWRKSGASYQFQDKDGSWETEKDPMRVYPFKPGQRLDRTLKSISGAGSGAPVTGMISVNTIFRGRLKLTNAGLIYSDWSNDTGISGGGVGGGASGRGVNMQGRYYLDGHMIAATDPAGNVKVGFIGGAHDEGDVPFTYLYMNGKQFSPIRADD